jgi:hypothetical protein
VSDVAPAQANVMQIAIAPLRQFAPLALPIAPGMEGLGELGEKPLAMMICH